MSNGIQGSQHVETLSSAGSTHHHTHKAPEPAQIASQHKMGCIHKKDGSGSCFCLLQPWLQFVFLNVSCCSASNFAGTEAVFKRLRPSFLRKIPTCVGLRLRPVSSSMRLTASGMLAGGWSRK